MSSHVQTTSQPPHSRRKKRRRILYGILIFLVLWLVAVMLYQTHRDLPPGVSYEGPVYEVDDVKFLYDLTTPDGKGAFHQQRQIYDRMMQMIDEAHEFIVMDLFLFNNYVHKDQTYPTVSETMTRKLIDQKKKYPKMQIVFVTDEINTNYDSAPNPLLEQLKKAGIQITITNVNPLRDSTPAYSAVWRTFFQWFGQSGKGWIPNLMASDGPKITARSYLKLLNVKANHRKVLATENSALISSGNVHNASAYHSNIAFEVKGNIIGDILKTEQAVMNFSGGATVPEFRTADPSSNSAPNTVDTAAGNPTPLPSSKKLQIRYLTEGKIYAHLLETIQSAEPGDTVWIGMFYIADTKVMDELVAASNRGAEVRLILDPNQNAFGQEKIGLPNRPVGAELLDRTDNKIKIRWYNTTKEQYHSKLIYLAKKEQPSIVMGGSANFTLRNLDDLNLENDLWVSAPAGSKLTKDMDSYFNKIWSNTGESYSLDFAAYNEKSVWFKDILYRLQKILGFTTY
ncbi:phosphatidylserine/phosphatidylglycerophosphate/cardiolipin synthase-like enzyme [Paenibacillus shirakamiensis]|uniref:phospholipase D n=1 Tax=Paenibacillus shirakamiensis TaxID=1265935 RepID=A0ABS4JJH0_9BACL|nr:phospholipase D family protein [Paenibacillus shirakamiensis]MBP2001845.1 phosphatidylserine/phosphatidylglycerophosphate/cardiolipin synthase-like enzyme [Paenibacillus shirakamiensis]